jgi:hypothetical protein
LFRSVLRYQVIITSRDGTQKASKSSKFLLCGSHRLAEI